jgi:hypothetical protein
MAYKRTGGCRWKNFVAIATTRLKTLPASERCGISGNGFGEII